MKTSLIIYALIVVVACGMSARSEAVNDPAVDKLEKAIEQLVSVTTSALKEDGISGSSADVIIGMGIVHAGERRCHDEQKFRTLNNSIAKKIGRAEKLPEGLILQKAHEFSSALRQLENAENGFLSVLCHEISKFDKRMKETGVLGTDN